MKRTNKILAAILALAVMLICFASCGGDVALSGNATIVIETAEDTYAVYEVDLSKLLRHDEGAISLLEYIALLEGSTLYYNVQWGGGYGAYITSIDALNPDPTNQYIAIYTNEAADFAVPSEWSPTVPTVIYEGKTLTYVGVGLSSMHVKDGTIILFRIEEF